MGQAEAKIISHHETFESQKSQPETVQTPSPPEDNFLQELASQPQIQDQLSLRQKSILAEMHLLRENNQWQSILDLFYPLSEKEPELISYGLDFDLRMELAFALGQVNSFDHAVKEYEACVHTNPDSFLAHSGLAYTLYNSLYAAKNRDILLTPEGKKQRVEKAHHHFQKAQELRPEAVTNYYRQGMLFKNLQNKPSLALPLFAHAVSNWRSYTKEQKKNRHQEKKNFIKALYNLASCHVQQNQAHKALTCIQDCIQEDRQDIISALNKHFALGKVHYHLGQHQKAKEALEFAKTLAEVKDADYVYELLARVHLALNQLEQGLNTVRHVPVKLRRPYVRWTESDLLLALNQPQEAAQTLMQALGKDRRSKHKTLIRLAKIAFGQKDYPQALEHAHEADSFHRQTFTTPDAEALFWKAAAHLYNRELDKAKENARELADFAPHYPLLAKLNKVIAQAEQKQ